MEKLCPNRRNVPGIIGLIFTAAYWLLPIDAIVDYLMDKCNILVVENRENNLKYEEASLNFLDDYDRENPMTTKLAEAAWLEQLKCIDSE